MLRISPVPSTFSASERTFVGMATGGGSDWAWAAEERPKKTTTMSVATKRAISLLLSSVETSKCVFRLSADLTVLPRQPTGDDGRHVQPVPVVTHPMRS